MSFVQSFMREEMKDKILVPMEGGKDLQGYYLKPPDGGWMQSTMILFTKGGIVVMGDLCPGETNRNSGVISVLGYGIDWFGRKLSESYLCSKFLDSHVWQRELAIDWLKGYLPEVRSGEHDGHFAYHDAEFKEPYERCKELEEEKAQGYEVDGRDAAEATANLERVRAKKIEGLEELLYDLEHDEVGDAVTFYRRLCELKDHHDEPPGYGYRRDAAGWLCAIQQRFAELYQQRIQEPAAR